MEAEVDTTLAALADPTRRGVMDLLRLSPRRAGDLADALSTTRPAMSRHLRVLRQAGLVSEESPDSDARARVYRLNRQPFSHLRGWLDEVEAFWGEQLAAFKAHAEKPAAAAARRRR